VYISARNLEDSVNDETSMLLVFALRLLVMRMELHRLASIFSGRMLHSLCEVWHAHEPRPFSLVQNTCNCVAFACAERSDGPW
jgi:hypothetical protein